MQVLAPTAEGIGRAVVHLTAGGVLGMPTETVYGLAADAFRAEAVAQVFAVKERPAFDPLIAHVAAGPALRALAPLVDLHALDARALARVQQLTAALWPGPLTLVLPRGPDVLDLATSGLSTVGVRMPAHPVAQALLEAFGGPLVAPSANRFGRISPTAASDVVSELGDRVPFVLDGGRCSVGVESTVVAIAPTGEVRVLRPGGVPTERLAELVGRPVATAPSTDRPSAPGQLSRHYAPGTPLALLPGALDQVSDPELRRLAAGRSVGWLRVAGPAEPGVERLEAAGVEVVQAVSLSPVGDLAQAARELFAALRLLDAGAAGFIIAESDLSGVGLGHAIDDRLARASAGSG